MAGRAATIEELDLVRTELERVRIRTEVLNQDIFRLDTRVADLYDMSDGRFDQLDAKIDAVDAKVEALNAKVEVLSAKVEVLSAKVDRIADEMKAMEERIVQRILAALTGGGTRN